MPNDDTLTFERTIPTFDVRVQVQVRAIHAKNDLYEIVDYRTRRGDAERWSKTHRDEIGYRHSADQLGIPEHLRPAPASQRDAQEKAGSDGGSAAKEGDRAA